MDDFKIDDVVRAKDEVDNGYYRGREFKVIEPDCSGGVILVERDDGVVIWFRSYELERVD